jgi:uridine kinase
MAYLIGIAGGTGAGKSTVVRALLDRFGGVCMDLDSYYLDRRAISAEERGDLNYDEPAAIDHTLLVEHLKRLKAGETVQKPKYSFHTHTRVGIEAVASSHLILVDGLFTLWWEEVRRLLDLKVFVDAPADLRLMRRIQRDVAERGRDIESVLRQYLQTVRPMHERYVEPTRVHADLVLNNGATVKECLESLMVAVERLVGRAEAREES